MFTVIRDYIMTWIFARCHRCSGREDPECVNVRAITPISWSVGDLFIFKFLSFRFTLKKLLGTSLPVLNHPRQSQQSCRTHYWSRARPRCWSMNGESCQSYKKLWWGPLQLGTEPHWVSDPHISDVWHLTRRQFQTCCHYPAGKTSHRDWDSSAHTRSHCDAYWWSSLYTTECQRHSSVRWSFCSSSWRRWNSKSLTFSCCSYTLGLVLGRAFWTWEIIPGSMFLYLFILNMEASSCKAHILNTSNGSLLPCLFGQGPAE